MQVHHYNLEPFEKETYLKYYLLGAFMTDGCVYSRPSRKNSKVVSLHSKDEDWLIGVNNFICPNKPLLMPTKNKSCHSLMYMCSKMGIILESLGCVGRKSLILNFPKVPEEYITDFLRGCWDGDGSLSFSQSKRKASGEFGYQWQANLTSGSRSFCDSLVIELSKLGIKSKVYTHSRKERMIEGRILKPSECWRVVLSGGSGVHRLCELLYNNDRLSMPRKKSIAISILENRISNNLTDNFVKNK